MPPPILVGVGRYTDRIEDPACRALSVVELGAEAARRALNDALGVEQLAPHIDVVAGVRQFETSTPGAVAVLRSQPGLGSDAVTVVVLKPPGPARAEHVNVTSVA